MNPRRFESETILSSRSINLGLQCRASTRVGISHGGACPMILPPGAVLRREGRYVVLKAMFARNMMGAWTVEVERCQGAKGYPPTFGGNAHRMSGNIPVRGNSRVELIFAIPLPPKCIIARG